ALVVAFRVAGVEARTVALGGAFTAVIFGLAAQQTLGNVIAGTVLLSARPFRVGDRVRLQGGPLAGQLEGTVSSLGLLYTKLARGDEEVMVPNSVVLNVAVLPLREPDSVDLRARLPTDVTPGDLQELLESSLRTPLRAPPRIPLEELDGDEVIVRIVSTPAWPPVPEAVARAPPLLASVAGAAGTPGSSGAAGGSPASLGASDRNSSSTTPASSRWEFRCGPPSQSSVRTPKRSRSSSSARARSRLPSREARTYSTAAAWAGSVASEGVRITTRASAQASRGRPGGRARRAETMTASGSELSPCSRRHLL